MKRTIGLETGASAFQRKVGADDIHNVAGRDDLLDRNFSDTAHGEDVRRQRSAVNYQKSGIRSFRVGKAGLTADI
jgi:hypothetical protein